MSLRRQMLLSVVNLEKYVASIFSNLYYDLIPNIVSGETIKDKGKAKLLEYSGNSVVENQLVNSTDTSFTFNDTHKYLKVIGGVASLYTGVVGTTISVSGGTDEIVDLTQKYPFDTPTSITDTRIQAYLNEGYHTYNSGTIKDSILGEIGSEPYNLFDGELEHGTINNNGTLGNNSEYVRTPTYIEVIPTYSYTMETTRANTRLDVFQYDKDNNFILRNTNIGGTPFTIDNNAKYIKFRALDSSDSSIVIPLDLQVCVHRTGTRTGYAPHTAPQKIQLPAPLQMSGVGTAKNSLEITSSAYVFTRNVWEVDFSTLSWNSTDYGYSVLISNAKSDTTNSMSEKYQYSSAFRTTANTYGWATTYLGVNTTSTPSGKLIYELATPQVISIPKKHLGVVDLGSLNWIKESIGNTYYFYSIGLLSVIKPATANNQLGNIVVYNWNTLDRTSLITGNNDKVISVDTNGVINVVDSSYNSLNATDFKTAMSGIYLFYETNTEVQDFTNKMNVEKGGTITGFEDTNGTVDCEVLPDVEMELQYK